MTPAAPLEAHPARLLPPDPGVPAIAGRATQLTDAGDQLTWTDEASQVSIKPDAATATTYADVHRSPRHGCP